jgi:hypothetical protein
VKYLRVRVVRSRNSMLAETPVLVEAEILGFLLSSVCQGLFHVHVSLPISVVRDRMLERKHFLALVSI